jgi:hypothetical protein
MNIKTLCVATLIATSALSCVVSAATTKDDTKQIVTRAVDEKTDLLVTVNPKQKSYKINEAINFNVSGNKDFYLYMFSVDENNKNVTLIFPNTQHQGNKFKKGHKNSIPSKKVEFISDRPGREKLIAIASTKYFSWDTEGYKTTGKFLQTDGEKFEQQVKAFRIRSRQATPQPTVEVTQTPSVVNRSARSLQNPSVHVQEIFATIVSGNIGVRNANQPSNHQNMVTEVQQQVNSTANSNSEQAQTDATATNKASAIVFSGTNKKVYKNGEVVDILVGANKAGTLHLFTAEPNGKLVFLTKQKVDGKSFVTMKAEATAPFGTHALVVAFSNVNKINDGYLKQQYAKQALAGQTKGLRLIQKPEPVSYSVSQFRIAE